SDGCQVAPPSVVTNSSASPGPGCCASAVGAKPVSDGLTSPARYAFPRASTCIAYAQQRRYVEYTRPEPAGFNFARKTQNEFGRHWGNRAPGVVPRNPDARMYAAPDGSTASAYTLRSLLAIRGSVGWRYVEYTSDRRSALSFATTPCSHG